MKIIKSLFILLCFTLNAFSQSPQVNIVWSGCFGGTDEDNLKATDRTFDNGYILAGYTKSTNGDVNNGSGNEDPWIVRLNSTGDTLWTKCFGDNNIGKANSIKETLDHGYIVTGINSNDLWVARLDISGNTTWQKCFGGSGTDEGLSIQQTTDGGFITVGMTSSYDGDIHGFKGNADCWVVRLSSEGDTLWTKCFGGTGIDFGLTVRQISDEKFVIIGSTESNDGDIVNNHGGRDIWVICITSTGQKIWSNCFGDTDEDSGFDINTTVDGNYIFIGQTVSKDRIATVMNGKQDIYIAKLSNTGDIIWNKTYGGSRPDFGKSIQQLPNGDYIVLGSTYSVDGDVSTNSNDVWSNIWVLKLSENGDIIWQKCFGGSESEFSSSVHVISNSEFSIAGSTWSSDREIKNQHGNCDFWIAEISDLLQTTNITADIITDKIKVKIDLVNRHIQIEKANIKYVELFDTTGKLILKTDEENIDIAKYQHGLYLISVVTKNNERLSTKLIF